MENFNKIDFRQRRDFGQVLGISFTFIKQNAKQLFKAILFLCGPPIMIGALLMGSFFSSIFDSALNQAPPDLTFFISLFGGMIIMMVGLFFSYAVILSYIKLYQVTEDGVIKVNDVWNEAKTQIMPLMGLGFLVGLLVIVGALFCYIPGIYLATALSFSFLILVMEGKGISESFSRSFTLIKGEWWSTFGVTFVMGLISSMLSYIFIIPLYVIMFVFMINNAGEPNPQEMMSFMGYLMMGYMPILYLAIAILNSFHIIALSFKYFAVVEEKESVGIMNEITQLDEETGIN